ncbi:MAG: 50S ribosomal protein L25/general stress protein Ctc [Flavobacteriales bacterium]|jgi:ribosomal protein L25, ctc-form|nr:50S ribosomal protein L25/general stress protein Ctc [Flavobacteriales bacterium]
MKSITLKGSERESVGKVSTNALRNAGRVPCVIYGGENPVHFSVEAKDLNPLVYTPDALIVDLELASGKKFKAALQDIQFHPVTENILHVDFIELFDDKPVTMQVPVKITGHSAGVRAGGVLVVNARKLQVRALPANLPDVIEVDITDLNIGDKSFVRTLQKENYKIMAADNYIVAYVKTSRNAAKNAAAAEGAAESK